MEELVVKIENVNGENVVSSRVIAEQLGKEHSDVTRKIKDTLKIRGIGNLSDTYEVIETSSVNEQNGKSYPEYLVTKDGFMLLMMNYVGYNDFKRAYINKFNEMEKALQNPLSMLLSLSKEQLAMNNLQLAQMIQEKDEVIEKQEVKLVEQKPLVEFAEQVSNSCDSIEIGLFSKIIQDENIDIGRNKLFQWLKDNGYLMKDNQPYQKYKTEGYFKVVEVPFKTPYGIRIGSKTLITGIGQIKILNKLKSSFGTSK
jgi:anti-repressor protein